MYSKDREGIEEILRRLEVLFSDIDGLKTAPPKSLDDMLQLLEANMGRSLGGNSWLAKIELLTWKIAAPFLDVGIRRQIRIVRELPKSTGWGSASTTDALMKLDDQIFKRTYGRTVEAPIKRVVRSIASTGAMGTNELKNLVINRCFRVDANEQVRVPRGNGVFSLGIVQILLAVVGLTPPILILLVANIAFGLKLLAIMVYAAPFVLTYIAFMRYFLTPYKLIPRAQKLLPRLQIVSLRE